MRPLGDVRQALISAGRELSQQHGAFTGRAVAMQANVGHEKARLTLKDMVRAGELAVVGQVRTPGVCRPLNVYRPVMQEQGDAVADLTAVVQSWADFR